MLLQPPPPDALAIGDEARRAAAQYTDVNAACPYPFDTAAGRIFREAFHFHRKVAEARADGRRIGIAARKP